MASSEASIHGVRVSINRSNLQRQLIQSIQGGQLAELARLLAWGTSVEFKTALGDTPASIAAYEGRTECLALLLQAGADVNARDGGGWTAAMFAAYMGNHECLARLIAAACDLSVQDHLKNSALSLALATGHHECVGMIRAGLEIQNLKAALESVGAPETTRLAPRLRV